MLVYDGMVLIRKILIDKATMNWVYLLILQGLRGLVKFWIKTFSKKKTHLILKTLLSLKTLLKKRNRKNKCLFKKRFWNVSIAFETLSKIFSCVFWREKTLSKLIRSVFEWNKTLLKNVRSVFDGKNGFEAHQ